MAENEIFKPGDVVRLKSGGHAMTVEKVSFWTGKLTCSWFNGAWFHQKARIRPKSLVIAQPEKEKD